MTPITPWDGIRPMVAPFQTIHRGRRNSVRIRAALPDLPGSTQRVTVILKQVMDKRHLAALASWSVYTAVEGRLGDKD